MRYVSAGRRHPLMQGFSAKAIELMCIATDGLTIELAVDLFNNVRTYLTTGCKDNLEAEFDMARVTAICLALDELRPETAMDFLEKSEVMLKTQTVVSFYWNF